MRRGAGKHNPAADILRYQSYPSRFNSAGHRRQSDWQPGDKSRVAPPLGHRSHLLPSSRERQGLFRETSTLYGKMDPVTVRIQVSCGKHGASVENIAIRWKRVAGTSSVDRLFIDEKREDS